MATSNMKRLLIVVYICTFSLMTPLGIAMGIALTHVSMEGSSTRTVEVAVLNGLAVGSLLYVVFFEILEKERSKKTNGLLQVLFSKVEFCEKQTLWGITLVYLFIRGHGLESCRGL